MPKLASLIVAAALLAPALAADDAQALVEKLASESWREREQAERALAALGEKAVPALRKAIEHDDIEVRGRASQALQLIGEPFEQTLRDARDSNPHLSSHGLRTLTSTFRLDDGEVLRELSPIDWQDYRGGFPRRSPRNAARPPLLAFAAIEAGSGFPILFSPGAQPHLEKILAQRTISIGQPANLDRSIDVANSLASSFSILSNGALRFRPMRMGQREFILGYINEEIGQPRQVSRARLLQQALAGSARAWLLLAEGLTVEPEARARLVASLASCTEPAALWLALALDEREAALSVLAATQSRHAVAALGETDWFSVALATRGLRLQPPEARSRLVSPRLAATGTSLEALAALWVLRGCELPGEARARMATLVGARDEGLAAAAMLWLAARGDLTPEEYDTVWQASQKRDLTSPLYGVVIRFLDEKQHRANLHEKARAAMRAAGASDAQFGVACGCLRDDATAEDRAFLFTRATDGIVRDQQQVLGGLYAGVFKGCDTLPDERISDLAQDICADNAYKRRQNLRILRALAPELRKRVMEACDANIARLAEEEARRAAKDKDRRPAGFNPRFDMSEPPVSLDLTCRLLGLRAAMGDDKALDELLARVEKSGQDVNQVKAAAYGLAEALDDDALQARLALLKRGNLANLPQLTLWAWLEKGVRAVENGDRAAFRNAQNRGLSVSTQEMYQFQQRYSQLQMNLDLMLVADELRSDLPRELLLDNLEITPLK